MSEDTGSLRDWLSHWGDGPNWADHSGVCVPIARTTLLALIDEMEMLRLQVLPSDDGYTPHAAKLRHRLRQLVRDVVRMRAALREIRQLALDGKLTNLIRVSIATVADGALTEPTP